MQSSQVVSGFSELKDLLIQTFQIEKPREKVKLYFTDKDDQVLMHDYDDHQKYIVLVKSIRNLELLEELSEKVKEICLEAIKNGNPAQHLNTGFRLNGFFRS